MFRTKKYHRNERESFRVFHTPKREKTTSTLDTSYKVYPEHNFTFMMKNIGK